MILLALRCPALAQSQFRECTNTELPGCPNTLWIDEYRSVVPRNLVLAIGSLGLGTIDMHIESHPDHPTFRFGPTGKEMPSFTGIVVLHPTNLFVGTFLIARRWNLAIEHPWPDFVTTSFPVTFECKACTQPQAGRTR